jgi:hypothetical protein
VLKFSQTTKIETFLPILGEITKKVHKNYFRDFQKYFSSKLVRDIMSLTNIRLLNMALCIASVGADLSANLLKIQASNYAN